LSVSMFEYAHPENEIVDDDHVILKDLTDEEWSGLLSHMERRKFPAGVTLLEAATIDRTLYIIVGGSVSAILVQQGKERELGIIGEGSVFGEISFLDGGPRTAAIRTREPVEVLSLSYEHFESLMAWQPTIACKLLLDVGRIAAQRLRHMHAS